MINQFSKWLKANRDSRPRARSSRCDQRSTTPAAIEQLERRKLLTAIVGTAGNDNLIGSQTDDTISGLGGNDTIAGNDGIDTIDGGSGDDNINGNRGDDIIHGGDGNDPSVAGGQGNDKVYGDAGNDTLIGAFGNDQLFGGTGNDSIEGGDDNDFIFDDDPRSAGVPFGDDKLLGGNGNDNIVSRGGNDTADGGAGADYFQYDAPADILSNRSYLGTLTIQNFSLTEDKIIMFSWANRGFGGSRLYDNYSALLAKTDQVGNDSRIHLYVGVKSGYGATETTATYEVAQIVLQGIPMSRLTPAIFDIGIGTDPSNPEIFGPQVDRRGNDSIGDRPNADTGKNQTISGAEGDDVINGRNGDDWIHGNSGSDHLFGDAGNDVLHAGKGIDFLHGGDGNDVLIGGNDLDFLYGEDGNDELYGDRVGTADDPLDPRVDRNDTLRGGRGSNRLEGGRGDDLFVIEPDRGTTDTIVDFGRFVGNIDVTNNDRIDVSAFPEIRTFELMKARAVQIGSDVIIDLTAKSLVIQNFLKGAIVPQMFIGNASISNSPPTNILLSSSNVPENSPIGTVVGTLSSEDPNGDGPYTYAFVNGTGDTDNSKFTMDGSGNLSTAAKFDFEVKSTYSIRIRSTDQSGHSFDKQITINVTNANDAPVLYGIEATPLSAVGPLSTPVTSSLSVYDQDSDNWTSATITITGNYQMNEDSLGFTNTSKITSVWNAANGTLTLSGTDSVSNYRTALRNVVYHNTSASPNIALTRSIGFQARDGQLSSNVVTRNLTVRSSSSAPVLSGFGQTLTFVKGAPQLTVAQNLIVSSPDGLNLKSATVSFTNWQVGDRLEFYNSYALQHTFTQDLVAQTAVLTITGNATAAHYQTMLRSVVFWNVAGNPVTSARRIATFTVKDSLSNPGTGSQEIAVSGGNARPLVLVNDATALTYKANNPAISIFSNSLVSDPDSNNLTRLTVQITSGYQNNASGRDLLSFTSQYGITGSFDAGTGRLTLSGSSYVGYYREVLRSVKFSTSGSAISTATRTFTVIATDDFIPSNATSTPVTRSLSVTP